jgi:SAM-dependent MidA family methyltransferase
MLVQQAVSRTDSIRSQLSRIRWRLGPLVFFLDSVPFSYSTGQALAEKIGIFIDICGDASPKKQEWVELGAGLGLLSRQVLDILKQKSPQLYSRLSWTVTDDTPELVENFEKQGLFREHPSARFAMQNAQTPTLEKGTNGVYLSYLLDSLSTAHIRIQDGHLFEVNVQSHLKEGAFVCDTSVYPPRFISGAELEKLFSKMDTINPVLAKQMMGCVKETYHEVPLEESNLSGHDKAMLKAFVKEKNLGNGYFNFLPQSDAWLDAINASLDEDAVILINDFGYTSTDLLESPQRLVVTYGGVICHNIFFPYLMWLAESRGFKVLSTHYEQGATQMVALVKGVYTKTVFGFRTIFSDLVSDKFKEVEKQLKTLPAVLHKEALIKQIWGDLTALEQHDYLVLMEFVSACYDHELYDLAIEFGLKLPEIYRYVAAPIFFLLGRSYSKTGDFMRAEMYLKASLRAAQGYALAHHQLSWIYLVQNRFVEYEEQAKAYITNSHDAHFADTFVTLSLINIQRKKLDEAKQLIDWIFDAHHLYPNLVPEDVLGKAKAIRDHYLQGKETA